jgi:hypothetical protein
MDWPYAALFLVGLVPIVWVAWLILWLTGPDRGA